MCLICAQTELWKTGNLTDETRFQEVAVLGFGKKYHVAHLSPDT